MRRGQLHQMDISTRTFFDSHSHLIEREGPDCTVRKHDVRHREKAARQASLAGRVHNAVARSLDCDSDHCHEHGGQNTGKRYLSVSISVVTAQH